MPEQKVNSKDLHVIFHQQVVANATQVVRNFKFKNLPITALCPSLNIEQFRNDKTIDKK